MSIDVFDKEVAVEIPHVKKIADIQGGRQILLRLWNEVNGVMAAIW
jgi:hypothetical protein